MRVLRRDGLNWGAFDERREIAAPMRPISGRDTAKPLQLEPMEVDRPGDSKTGSKVATEFEPCLRRLQKDMGGDWFSVYLKNHLNLSIAFPTRYLAMSSLFAFRLFPVMQEFGDEVLCS